MQKSKYWHKLDNAAKVFPAISRSGNSNVFRLSFHLKDKVNKDLLNEAVNICLKRFETFNIQLRNGLFWNYFSENKNIYEVEVEPFTIGEHFKFNKNKGYLFKVYYLDKKITLETFHSLADGTGSMEFLKAIVYEYLTLKGFIIDHENMILTKIPFSNSETEDSFNANYDKAIKKQLKESKAHHLTGDKFKEQWSLVMKLRLPIKEIIKVAKEKYNATITEYLTTVLAYSIYMEGANQEKKNKPIKMFVPVNLRPYFDSSTLRNFSLYVKANFDLNKKWTFIEMLELTKASFYEQLNYMELKMHIGSLVGLEKNPFIKFVPLVIKNIFFKIGYKLLGESINTSSISNLGIVNLPNGMAEHVADVEFINTGPGLNSGVITYKDHLNFSINTIYKDISIIRHTIFKLRDDGINLIIDTNFREGYDEIL